VSYTFDYEKKVWGSVIPTSSPFSLAGLRFYYFLKNITLVRGSLLEVGCGAGGNLYGLRKYRPYLHLYGVDISKAAIEYGVTKFPILNLVVSPAETLPFEKEYFDAVCFFDVLEHVEDPLLCLKEASRVLKSGGTLHAYIPVEGEIFSLHGILNRLGINLKEKTAGHIQKLTKKNVIKMCVDSGFEVTEYVWSCHLINQIGDLLYYLILTLTGKRLTHSLEATTSSRQLFFLNLFKNLIAFLWYWESRLLWFLPGAGIHITCKKIAH
jgi:SAM-dependent methyltransferase